MNIYNQSDVLATTATEHDNKVGWYEAHNNYDIVAKRLHLSGLLIRDSIVAGLSRYQMVSKKYFKTCKALNRDIPGDRTQHFLSRAEDLSVRPSVKYVVWFIVASTTLITMNQKV